VRRVLIVADAGDANVAAVAAVLRTRNVAALLASPVHLALAGWRHSMSAEGHVQTCLALGERIVDADSLGAVWFRAASLPAPRFRDSAAADRDYAQAELHALVVSWLQSLGGRIVNAVDGNGLCGPSWAPTRWLTEARRAGLPIAPQVMATSARFVRGWRGSPFAARQPLATAMPPAEHRVLVVDDRTVGGPDASIAAACMRLAAAARCRILRVGFVETGPQLAVSMVDPGGGSLDGEEIDAMAAFLADLVARSCHVTR
jgi:hypothetical protein